MSARTVSQLCGQTQSIMSHERERKNKLLNLRTYTWNGHHTHTRTQANTSRENVEVTVVIRCNKLRGDTDPLCSLFRMRGGEENTMLTEEHPEERDILGARFCEEVSYWSLQDNHT